MADKEELGVEDLAKYMKKSPTVVRAMLRESKVKKSGKTYSWTSKGAMQATAKKLGHSAAPAAKAKKAA